MFKLFREPQPKEITVIGADPADEGSSYCAAVAKSKKRADSFMVYHGHTNVAQFGHEIYKMALYIRQKTDLWPIIGVERNIGQAAIYVLQTYNYSQLFRMKEFDTREKKEVRRIGWHTNMQTRPKMLGDLGLALTQNATRIYDIETVRELFKFITNAKTGRPEAATGATDDLVFAEAIAWQLYQLAKPMGMMLSQDQKSIAARFPKQELFDEGGFF